MPNNMGMNLKSSGWLLLLALLPACHNSDTDKLITLHTRLGDIKLVLFDDTPLHKKSFLEMAEAGAYDSTTFNRVIRHFMIQGGDVSTNPKYDFYARRLIPAEIKAKYFHKRGMIGAARQSININPKRKSSTQFYIVQGRKFKREELTTDIARLNSALPRFLYDGQHQELIDEFRALQDSGKNEELQQRVLALRPEIEEALGMNFENTKITEEQIEAYTTVGGAPHLDGGYTIFGQVVEGMATVDKIASLPVDSTDKPLEPVYMTLSIEEVPKDSITAWYGIEYPKPAEEK